MTKTKEKKKSKGKTVVLVIVGILVAAIAAAVIYVNVMTRPQPDTQENKYIVGGMIYSDTVEYKCDSAKGIRHNPVIRMMQMIWRFCQDGDTAKHAVQTPPSGIHEDTDIPYIDDGNMFHRLDVYYPEGKTAADNLPAIVDIHGGGWMYGDKDLNKYYCLELANKGYVVFNISYRLVPDVTVNEQIQDCFAAMNYISGIYAQYTGNKNMLLTGDSAGGMLASYTAAIMGSPALQERFGVTYEAALQPTALLLTSPAPYMKEGGAMSLYSKLLWGSDYKTKGTYDLMDINEILEHATLPPAYLITSDGDTLAHDQTVQAYELFREKGIECEMVNFGNDENGNALPHVFSVLNPFDKAGQEAIDGGLAFYQKAMK